MLDVVFNLLGVFLFQVSLVSHPFGLFHPVVFNHFLRCRSLIVLLGNLILLFPFDISLELEYLISLVLLSPSLVFVPLLLGVQNHLLPHLFLGMNFALEQLLLLGFSLHLFSGLLKNALVELHNVLFLLCSELGPDCDLLIEHLLDVVGTGFVLVFLFLLLRLVEVLAELLDFTPLVITYI